MSDNLTYIYINDPELFNQLVNDLAKPKVYQTSSSAEALLGGHSSEEINKSDNNDKEPKNINRHFYSSSKVHFFKVMTEDKNTSATHFEEKALSDLSEELDENEGGNVPTVPRQSN